MIEPKATSFSSAFSDSALNAQLLIGGSEAHARAEADLLSQGVMVPLPHRAVWARTKPDVSFWFLALMNQDGMTVAGFTMEVYRARTYPGQLLLRSKRWGASVPDQYLATVVKACAEILQNDSRVLQLDLELFELDAHRRAERARALAAVGFRNTPHTRTYSNTLLRALPATDAEHLASLSAKTRRDIRAASKHAVEIRPIDSDRYVPRMEALMSQTFGRTGGYDAGEDWRARIAMSVQAPHLSRMVGLFRANDDRPDALLAFAWGCCHGEYAHYESSGSSRPDDLRIPFTYCLLWDLKCWARANGARWFDMGGIPHERPANGDPMAGIAQFKRNFADTVVPVGERWIFHPSPVREAIARRIRTATDLMRMPQRIGRARVGVALQSIFIAPISFALWHRFANHVNTAALTISAVLRRR